MRDEARRACDVVPAVAALGDPLQPRRPRPGRATLRRSALLAQLVEHSMVTNASRVHMVATDAPWVARNRGNAGHSLTVRMPTSVHAVPRVATTAV